jgi:hypothetical protein
MCSGGKTMRRIIPTAIAFVLFMTSTSAVAWEFNMDFGYYWNYYYMSPLGRNHLFGPHDADATGSGQYNNVNFWAGVHDFQNGFYSGDCSVQTQYIEISPQLRANKAVRFRAKLWIGEWDNSQSSEYRPNSSRPGTNVAFSEIQVTQAWLTAQTPWGVIVAGKRPLSFGIGTWLSGSDNTTTESLALIVPYGPFRFMASIFPSRHLTDLYNDPGPFAGDPPAVLQQMSPEGDDTTNLRSPEISAAIMYSQGPFEIGIFYEYLDWEVRPETFSSYRRDDYIPRDWHADWGVIYAKYNNGRFFLNGEVDFFLSTVRNRPNVAGVSSLNGSANVALDAGTGSVFQTTYTEMWRAAVELGALIGPAKVTFMWSWIPGFDRRHGIYIDRQPNAMWISENAQIVDAEDWFRPPGMVTLHPDFSNAGFFLPYSYLLAHQYSGGVGTNMRRPFMTRNGDGQLVDANVYGARIDYAVAANLNLWCSFLWAERVSHGYGWGHLSLPIPPIAPEEPDWTVMYDNKGRYTAPSPAIPNNFLGYEIGFGLDWQLLEALRLHSRLAVWQPGDWWKFACTSKDNMFWTTPWASPFANWGINPNRAIDPIFGLQVTLAGEF